MPVDKEKVTILLQNNHHIANVSLPSTYYRYFEVAAGYFMTQGGTKNYKNSLDYRKYKDSIGGELDLTTMTNKTIAQGNAVNIVL